MLPCLLLVCTFWSLSALLKRIHKTASLEIFSIVSLISRSHVRLDGATSAAIDFIGHWT
jgi:hypothetical protein